ncbi:MAG: ABC transporter permease [Planctomycetota bacterium]|jgi:ABC-2 type transport system permease protein
MNETRGWIVVWLIARREVVHIVRRPVRIAAAVGTPLVLWLLLGSGFAASLKPAHTADASYAAFLLPGMMTLVAVFAAVFSAISLIDERQTGWLQSVLVSPAPRWSIAVGKTVGGGFVALVQAALLLPAAPVLDVPLGFGAAAQVLIGLMATCAAMTALGVAFAWRSESTASFHAVMNLVFMPMWVLSGAFFPASGASTWLGTLMAINPLSWCTQAIRGPLAGPGADEPWITPIVASILFAAAAIAVATWIVRGRPES